MDFQTNAPIYVQLMEEFKSQIASGKLAPGEKLASVRELALQYGVNPNTMQKALGELEWEHLLYTMRTSGRFVTEDQEVIQAMRKQLAEEKIAQVYRELEALGFAPEEIVALLTEYKGVK